MDIDQLFKSSKIPMGGKRKLPDNPTPEMLKKLKMDSVAPTVPLPQDTEHTNGASSSHKGKRRATVEDVDDDEDDVGMDVSMDFPGDEDDEGRFFGGGLTSEQDQILSIFENAAGGDPPDDAEQLSITGIRRLLLRFERSVNKNQEQRSKYPNDPSKFIDSEADLDAALKSLLPLAQAPALAYPEIVRSGSITLLVGLLSHENADIVIDVVEVIHELTDEDVGTEGDDDNEESNSEALKILIEGLIENAILELLVDNLSRLNEAEDSDRQGVFHILGFFENVLGFNPQLATRLVAKTKILPWLLRRVQAETQDDNRGYAAELLSILLQNERLNRIEFGNLDGVEVILKILSRYRRKDPGDADETEYMENLFDALCSALSEPSVKEPFLKAEGPDLMVLIMKEKSQAQSRAIKTLNFAMSGQSGSGISVAFVEALGLKYLFSTLMGKSSKRSKSTTTLPASEDTGHILGILASLFSNLDLESDSIHRMRLLAKFVEGNYDKVDKILEVRETAKTRTRETEADIEKEKQTLLADGDDIGPDEEDMWYLRRLDGGLFVLQTVDYILAWIAMEDDGIRTHLLQMLNRKNQGLDDIVSSLKQYRDNLDDNSEAGLPQGPSQKEILQGLIGALSP